MQMHVRFSTRTASVIALMAAMSFTALHADAPATPAEIQKARHDHYHALGEASKKVRDLIRSSKPDFAVLEQAAEHIEIRLGRPNEVTDFLARFAQRVVVIVTRLLYFS